MQIANFKVPLIPRLLIFIGWHAGDLKTAVSKFGVEEADRSAVKT